MRSTTSPYDPTVTDTFAEPTWGEVEPEVFTRIVVVSPHFDDAAMGAGHLLASYPDTTVITVLGGRPPAYPAEPTEWDALGGFVAGDDVVAVRREEDVAAMAVLESGYQWLDFSDHQYLAPADRPTPADVAPVLGESIAALEPTAVFFPMGLANPDHVMVHDACLDVMTAAAGPHLVLLRGPRLQAPARHAGLAGGEAAAGPALADARHRPARARRGAQAPGHLVLHLQIAPLERDHALSARLEGTGARAVLAPRSAAAAAGRGSPTSSERGPERDRPAGLSAVAGHRLHTQSVHWSTGSDRAYFPRSRDVQPYRGGRRECTIVGWSCM